jgi:branched-chain amino acid transport system substrate-binding protein
MKRSRIRLFALGLALALVAASCNQQDGDDEAADGENGPIVVGGTLPLTGALAPTGVIHQITGELFLERLNEDGGLLGRQVEWQLLDDESDTGRVSTLYERLITEEGVDLIVGPYATPNIVAAMAVAERHGYVLPQHTAVLAYALTYRCQFPAWSETGQPNEFVPDQVFDALDSLSRPPKTIAFVTNQAGSTDYISHGAPDVDDVGAVDIARQRGYDVVLDIGYPPDISDWVPIASDIRDADPDFVWMGALGVDPVGLIEAFQQLDYDPRGLFALFPAPGPLLGLGDAGEGTLSVSIFESNEPILEQYSPEVRDIVDAYQAAAQDADIPYTAMETQAVASWTAWEILASGVEGAESLDQEAICDHLLENGADTTFFGQVEFDPEQNNFGESPQGVKQIQDGEWVMVWPSELAAAPPQELD